mmetsp:Transcript_1977/g.3800  ORF Transcript_1977/g.3800 Transcript_1977/m.3800 type:complete len:165 (+) Transcript_1977:115-609(+)
MPSSNRIVAILGSILAIAIAVVHGFSKAPVFLPSRSSTTSLHMGIFDAFQKAFSNEEYGPPPDAVKATARHILVPTEEEAKSVMSKFSSGEISFAALAGEYSTCPSKSRGGSLGSFSPGTMVKEFDEVIFSPQIQIGELVGPVKTKFGYHLIVVDKRAGGSDWY